MCPFRLPNVRFGWLCPTCDFVYCGVQVKAAVEEIQMAEPEPEDAQAGVAIYGEAGAAADAAKEDNLVQWMDRCAWGHLAAPS